jgi:hypothetical protein
MKVIKRQSEGSLGLDRQSVLIKSEVLQALLIQWQTGCLKSESASALIRRWKYSVP